MPRYHFHLYDDVALLRDEEGLVFIDVAAARDHAVGVARELTFKSADFMEQNWSNWTMRVHDHEGTELFSLAMSDFELGNHNP
jgi:hypothetical protein